MVKIYDETSDDALTINWQLSKFCEKKCHYCTSWDARKTIKFGKVDGVYTDDEIEIHDNIASYLNSKQDGTVMMYGGEPTLHPKGIEYFNMFCKDSISNKKTIYLVTHGDISYEKIMSIDPGNKKEYMISISYHYLQVNFDEWLEKIKLFHNRTKCLVSAIIPRQLNIRDDFINNIKTLLDNNINVELKLEFDRDLNTNPEDFKLMYSLITECNEKNNFLKKVQKGAFIILEDNVDKYRVTLTSVMLGIPLIPNKSLCINRQMGISAINKLSASCSQGKHYDITKDTTDKQFEEYINNNSKIFCTRESCTENRHDISSLKVMGVNLDDSKFVDFLKNSKAIKIEK